MNRLASIEGYRKIIAVAMATILGLLAIAGVKSWRDLRLVRSREESLHGQISATRERIEVLTARIERIENDPATLERLAREQLGMLRKGDLVIVLPPTLEPGELESSPHATGPVADP